MSNHSVSMSQGQSKEFLSNCTIASIITPKWTHDGLHRYGRNFPHHITRPRSKIKFKKKKEHYNRLFKFFHLPFSIMRTVKQNSNDLNQERQIIGEKQKIQIVTCQTFYLELSDLLKFTSHKKFAASFTT